MKVIAVLLLAFVALTAANMQQFIEFQHKYGKTYQTAEEFNMRYSVFLNNLAIAAKLTKKGNATYGVTKFSDMTTEEFKNIILMKRKVNRNIAGPVWTATKKVALPTSYDWRDKGAVTPVYNQGQCGSCWAFSITENIESQWFLAGNTLTSLSMQQVVSCDTSDDGCGGGDPPTAYQYVMSAGGIETYQDYPYTGEGSCQFNKADVDATLSNWQYVTQSGDEGAMQQFVYQSGPISVCVDAESWQSYSGGIITTESDCGTSLDHCVDITGWGAQESTNFWWVRNSWGADWGESGYLQVQLGANVCGIANEVTSAIVS
jgi:C1A family cysteine protease